MQRTENWIYISPIHAAGSAFAAAVLQRQKETGAKLHLLAVYHAVEVMLLGAQNCFEKLANIMTFPFIESICYWGGTQPTFVDFCGISGCSADS